MRTSKYSNQTKVICGLTYHSHEYAYPFEGAKYKKLRITTTYNDVDYEYWTSTQTWKNPSENKNSSFDPNGWRFSKYFKAIIKTLSEIVVEREILNEVNAVIGSMAWMFSYSVNGTIERKIKEIQKRSNAIKKNDYHDLYQFDEFDEEIYNTELDFRLEKINEAEELLKEALVSDRWIKNEKLIAEAKVNGFEKVEDYITFVLSDDIKKAKIKYELTIEDHEELRFRWNAATYLENVYITCGKKIFNKAYKELAKKYHPDMGGDENKMVILAEVKQDIIKEYDIK